MIASQMPRPARAKSAVASLSLNCLSGSEGSVRCLRRFFARRNRWPAGETGAVRGMFEKIVEADRVMVAFEEEAPAGG